MTSTSSVRRYRSRRMRWLWIAPVVLAAVTVAAPSALAVGSEVVNGTLASSTARQVGGASLAAAPQLSSAVSCAVLDPNGEPVTQVQAMSFGDAGYWLQFRSDGELARTVRFTLTPQFTGSPAQFLQQNFNTDHSSTVTTPFGVPDWGADKTTGPWELNVRDNLGRSATCPFEVVPS
jgi:hypothetical protein